MSNTAWIVIIVLGYKTGKSFEKDPLLNWKHVLASAVVTVALILFILFQQWNVGNLGPKSDSVLCSDYCLQQGYPASGMPPRASGDKRCSCVDASGKEVLDIPLGDIPK